MGVNPSFWFGKRIFLTGHTGFKGSWLGLWLQEMGAKVCGYALPPPTTPSLFELADLASGMVSHIGDVRDADKLVAAVQQFQPDIVFHMAAQALVHPSYADPVGTYATNVMGTVHLLEAVRATKGVRAVINVTSDKCYENREWLWGYRETEAMGGHDPYSSSKGCAELVTQAYRRSFFQSDTQGAVLASARAGNVIGGGDWAAYRLVPDIIRAIGEGQPVVIRSPKAIRPWQHVLEPLSGYLTLAQKLWEEGPSYGEGWNFGPSDADARPVDWLVDRLITLWGEGASWKLDQQVHPHEAHYLKLDSSKARQQMGWLPRWSLADTLEHVVDWYKAWHNGADMRALTCAQIQTYQQTQPGS